MKKAFLFLALLAAASSATAMPVAIPVVAAYFAAGAFVAATTTAAAIFAGMAFAGAALTVMGTITESPKLVKFGGILGLAGGVGSIVSKGMETAAMNAAQETAMAEAADTAAGMVPGGSAAAPELANTAVDSAGQLAQGATAQPPPIEANRGLIDAQSPYNDPSRSLDVASSPAEQVAQTSPVTSSGDAAQAAQATPATPATPATQPGNMPPNGGPQELGVKDYLSKGSDFLRDNKTLVEVGGKMIQGASQEKSLQDRQQAQWDEEARRRAAYNASVSASRVPAFRPRTAVQPVVTPAGA